MRISRPYFAELSDIQIQREGERALIIYADSSIPPTELWLGEGVDALSDEDILHRHNSIILAQGLPPEEWMVVEIPPGRAQISYEPRYGQWVTRGEALRCRVLEDRMGGTAIQIDEHELSMREFAQLLSTHAGWGVRMSFVPEDALMDMPQRVLWDPPTPPNASTAPDQMISTTKPIPPIDRLLTAFLAHMEQQYSRATASRYRQVLSQLLDHLDHSSPAPSHSSKMEGAAEPERDDVGQPSSLHTDPRAVLEGIDAFLRDYAGERLPVSCHVRRSIPATIKQLLNWLAQGEYIDEMTRRRAIDMVVSAANMVQRAEKALCILHDYVAAGELEPDIQLETGHYRILQVQRTSLLLADPLGLSESHMRVKIPSAAGRLVDEDWILECRLGLHEGRWMITSLQEIHIQ